MAEKTLTIEKQIAERFHHIPQPYRRLIEGLYLLALDQRGSSSATADELWGMVDEQLWFEKRNPWILLQVMSEEKLKKLADDKSFLTLLRRRVKERQERHHTPGWFQENFSKSDLKHVAYFCMEFGLSEALPIYSGGLGILAGDHMKTASDLDVRKRLI